MKSKETIGGHEKIREHRNMALLLGLLFTILPTINLWTHGKGRKQPQLTHVTVQEEAPIQDPHGKFYRSQKDPRNVEI